VTLFCPTCDERLRLSWDEEDGYDGSDANGILVIDDSNRWEPVPEPDTPIETIRFEEGITLPRGWLQFGAVEEPDAHFYCIASGPGWARVRRAP
jgi:hypothetical protein